MFYHSHKDWFILIDHYGQEVIPHVHHLAMKSVDVLVVKTKPMPITFSKMMMKMKIINRKVAINT